MARVFSGAADTVRCEENTWRLNAGPIDLYPRRWIGYCREQDHISPATKRASDEERTAHRSWSFSHLLIKGLFHGKTLALTVTGCGQDEIDRQCSDPLLIAHPHLDPHPLSAFKFFQDKYPGFYGQKYLRNGDGGSGYAEAEIARSLQLGGIPIVSAIGGKKGGLHGSDLLSPAPKVNRSGLDLTILTKKTKEEPAQGHRSAASHQPIEGWHPTYERAFNAWRDRIRRSRSDSNLYKIPVREYNLHADKNRDADKKYKGRYSRVIRYISKSLELDLCRTHSTGRIFSAALWNSERFNNFSKFEAERRKLRI